jgi:hypothetical protein
VRHRFQVTLWVSERAEFQTVEIVADTKKPDEVKDIFARPGVEVRNVTDLGGVIDWNSQVFNREEAGVYIRATEKKIDHLMGEGKLPKARDGRPLFTRRQLDAYVEEGKAA